MLVVRKFEIKPESEQYLLIEGRESGFFNALQKNIATRFMCDDTFMVYEKNGGAYKLIIPVTGLTAVGVGISKNINMKLLGASILSLVIMVINTFMDKWNSVSTYSLILGLVLGLITFLAYHYSTRIAFNIYAGSHSPLVSFCVKKAVLNGINVEKSLYDATVIMTQRIAAIRNPQKD